MTKTKGREHLSIFFFYPNIKLGPDVVFRYHFCWIILSRFPIHPFCRIADVLEPSTERLRGWEGERYTLSGHHPNHRAQRDNNKKVWQFDFSGIDERIIAKRSENCNSPPITMCHRPFSFCVVPFPSFSCGPVFFFVAFNYQAGRVISGGGGSHTCNWSAITSWV